MADFTMPALGADMETAKVVQWHVRPGDSVKSGDVVAVVETHKGAIDVECFLDGVIEELAPLNVEMPIGALMAKVHRSGDAVSPSTKSANTPITAAANRVQVQLPDHRVIAPTVVAPVLASRRVKASPAARHEASRLGIALQNVRSSGRDGAVTLDDVRQAAPTADSDSQSKARVGSAAGFDPVQMRHAIAAAMTRSKREIPHYYLCSTIDFFAAQVWLDAWNAGHEPRDRLLPATLLLKATAVALAKAPQLNGFYEGSLYRAAPDIHVGWAVALRGGGLVAPAIHHADRLALPALMVALRDLVQRARAGGLRSSELTDPTITVTNLGERGAESVLGVIYPPQVAIVGFGRVLQRPWAVQGQIVARPLVNVSLAADHRASDGHVGGQLLAAIDAALQNPDTL
jgi:pyruvate dehydrogenase E2 component (dihydrolipoamide acetyltransferase)